MYILALINPVSKVFLLSVLYEKHSQKELRETVFKSSVMAFLILLFFAAAGQMILNNIFNVNIYSLKVTGGLILFFIGYRAVSKGKFFEISDDVKLSDVSIVPLVSPMIAGPATITAVLSFTAQHGFIETSTAMTFALLLNLLIMLLYDVIHGVLSRCSLMGPLIRLTGLIVSTIAVQMVFDGLGEW